eukprot:1178094-Prorocentrum_minimum.AAC.3
MTRGGRGGSPVVVCSVKLLDSRLWKSTFRIATVDFSQDSPVDYQLGREVSRRTRRITIVDMNAVTLKLPPYTYSLPTCTYACTYPLRHFTVGPSWREDPHARDV